MLKPYGWMLINGGPHWKSGHGHHLYRNINGTLYTFDKNNPIQPFSHLYLNPKEMQEFLVEREVPLADVDQIVYEIYQNSHINRYSFDYIHSIASKYPWVNFNFSVFGYPPPAEIALKIALASREFGCFSDVISLALQKYKTY